MASDPVRIDAATLIVRAARGLGKVDVYGNPRGVTLVTSQEIDAMALLLAIFGLTPIPPGAADPADARTLLTRKDIPDV